MQLHGVEFPESPIAALCLRHGVSRLSLFGSILRDDFRPDSDIDMLVEFLPGRTPGIVGFGQIILDLSALLGRRVDLRTPFDLSPYFRPSVLRHAKTLHAA
ncbi:MAG: nucleotidyltransferase family protein [Phycisphaerales bacterium]|nr:nucleotidyltransferase family protein [Phycisphaerales bacterium]